MHDVRSSVQISQMRSREKKLENVILIFELPEQIFQDCEKEHIFPMILSL